MIRDLPFGSIRDTNIRVPFFSVVVVFIILEDLNDLRSTTKLIDPVTDSVGITDGSGAVAVVAVGIYNQPPPPPQLLLLTTTLSVYVTNVEAAQVYIVAVLFITVAIFEVILATPFVQIAF